jgi:5,6,7,8-tetrahydromethanopterin hydro-lyase
MNDAVMLIGEGFAGNGVNAAHINVIMGPRNGPVGTAWATSLASPSAGHVPFMAVAAPGIPIRPFTLFINKAAIESERHGQLTWGGAQAGIAAGVGLAHKDFIFRDREEWVLIVAVWVNPAADDEEAVFKNNRDATVAALQMSSSTSQATMADIETMLSPSNPYFRQK